MDTVGERHGFPTLVLRTPVGAPALCPSEAPGPVGKEPLHSPVWVLNQHHPDRGTLPALAVALLHVSQLLLGQEQLLEGHLKLGMATLEGDEAGAIMSIWHLQSRAQPGTAQLGFMHEKDKGPA